MSFNGNESEIITLQEAVTMTSKYLQSNQGATKAHFFGKEKLLDLLNQNDCVGIRAYYGLNEQGEKQLIFVGANSQEEDIFDGIILDRSVPCPNHCATLSPL